MSEAVTETESPEGGSSKQEKSLRYRELSKAWRKIMAAMTACSIILAVNQIFNLGFFVGYVVLDSRYMYMITGVMLCMVFITFPANRHSPTHVPWYDIAIMVVIAIIFSYYAYFAERIVLEAWEYAAPQIGVWLALVTWVIVLEAGRRAGGWPVFAIVLVFSLYPTFAASLPNVVAALSIPIQEVATALWNDDEHSKKNREIYNKKFKLAKEIFKNHKDFYLPDGGFYLWLKVGNGEKITKILWKEKKIKVMPGAYLSKLNSSKAYIRIALISNIKETKAALKDISSVLSKYQK